MKDASDKISGLFFLFFSGYVCMKGLQLRVGGFHRPGSGFLPFWSGVALGILALLLLLQAFVLNKTPKEEEGKEETNLKAMAVILFCLIGYVAVLELLGSVITTALFVGVLLKAVEKKGWFLTVWVSLLIALSCYFVFVVLLGSDLPRGIQELIGL
jgi:putative tricarboxylic transport membrane protein